MSFRETVANVNVGVLSFVTLSSVSVPESSEVFKSIVMPVTSMAVKSTSKLRGPVSPH